MESILTSIKKLLGLTEEYEHFDADLIMHINSVFSILTQLGVGRKEGFMIAGKEELWSDFITDKTRLQFVKTFMHLKVKLIFDPPLNSAVIESMKQTISELEWRINVAAESEEEAVTKEYEAYTGNYNIMPKAFSTQTLDTADRILDEDIVILEVPYYETSNEANGVTSYIAREGF